MREGKNVRNYRINLSNTFNNISNIDLHKQKTEIYMDNFYSMGDNINNIHI